jgi:hypothetical protein
MRRRLRERRREREARLLDLGALVYELHRQGKRAPELLQEKAAELALIDEEVRELEAALDGDGPGAPDSEVDEPDEPDEAAREDEEEAEDEGAGEPEDDDAAETHEADALDAEPEDEDEDDADREERPE